jgi:integrase
MISTTPAPLTPFVRGSLLCKCPFEKANVGRELALAHLDFPAKPGGVDFVTTALEAVPKISERYFFWTGESKTDSATGDWQSALKGAFKKAEIPDGHAHRFRDTFAVSLLQAGVPMEQVSVLLGHNSIRVTEKHYSPWVRARQELLEADVRRTWQGLQGTESTQKV